MFKGEARQGDLNGFLDSGSHIHGELRFEDTFRIDGKVTGKVVSTGNLVVGQRGIVEGEIEVGAAFISGQVRGRVRTRKRLEIAAGARVEADLETPCLLIEEGAHFQGGCSMPDARKRAASSAPSPKVAALPLGQERK
jgi:cytoskeletal protein CcmA (bactofilin family)